MIEHAHLRGAAGPTPDTVDAAAAVDARTRLGWVPALTAVSAAGVLLVVIADGRSRSMTSSSQSLFWLGLLVIYFPIAFRLALPHARRGERLSLSVLLGLALYLVKVLRDPFAFTFSDELAHAPNANMILETHHLFHVTSILPVTSYYPGLESVTAALSSLSGLTTFGAGLIVIGTARVVIILALFLLVESLSGSSRAAGVAVAAYAVNPNFVFFSAQFSYESLALPLLVAVLFAYTAWRSRPENRTGWTIAVVLLTAAVVATHHMSSYALTAVLVVVSLAYLAYGRGRRAESPWPFALVSIALVAAWLVLVASATVGYLTPVFNNAFLSTIHTVAGEARPRHLFQAASHGYQPSALERAVGFTSVLLLAVAYPFGAWRVWLRHRSDPFAVVLTLAAGGVFAAYALRFAPGAWETANRTSEFLFLGLGFVVALVGLDHWAPRRAPMLGPLLTACALAVIFAGGVTAGWTPALRLAQPYRIEASDSRAIDPEGRELARWARATVPRGARFAASAADARLLATYGNVFALAGKSPDVEDVLQTSVLPAWERDLLLNGKLRYAAVDLRLRSFDNTAGYFFGFRPGAGRPDVLLDPGVFQKFDNARADRVFDSGNILVYDLHRW